MSLHRLTEEGILGAPNYTLLLGVPYKNKRLYPDEDKERNKDGKIFFPSKEIWPFYPMSNGSFIVRPLDIQRVAVIEIDEMGNEKKLIKEYKVAKIIEGLLDGITCQAGVELTEKPVVDETKGQVLVISAVEEILPEINQSIDISFKATEKTIDVMGVLTKLRLTGSIEKTFKSELAVNEYTLQLAEKLWYTEDFKDKAIVDNEYILFDFRSQPKSVYARTVLINNENKIVQMIYMENVMIKHDAPAGKAADVTLKVTLDASINSDFKLLRARKVGEKLPVSQMSTEDLKMEVAKAFTTVNMTGQKAAA